jgi:hypothetical protein
MASNVNIIVTIIILSFALNDNWQAGQIMKSAMQRRSQFLVEHLFLLEKQERYWIFLAF